MIAVRRAGTSLAKILWVSVRRSWMGAARVVGRYHTVASVAGAALAISFGAMRQASPVVGAPESSAEPSSSLLRVCADPRNLLYSNNHIEGFENELAELVGRGLDAEVTYSRLTHRPSVVGNTLDTGDCDVLMGVPSSIDMVLTTRPYYRSTYVFVWRSGEPWSVESFDDPILRAAKVGVQIVGEDVESAPPLKALEARGIVSNVQHYSAYDPAGEAVSSQIIDAVASGEIDVAVVWGPLAAYFAKDEPVALTLQPVSPEIDPPPFPVVFDLSLAVRHGDEALRDKLDAVLTAHEADIDALLARYSVPRRTPASGRVRQAMDH